MIFSTIINRYSSNQIRYVTVLLLTGLYCATLGSSQVYAEEKGAEKPRQSHIEYRSLNVKKEIDVSAMELQMFSELLVDFDSKKFPVESEVTVNREVLLSKINRNGLNSLSDNVDVFMEASKKYKVNNSFLVAVSVVETSYGTSDNLKLRNNVGGIRCIESTEEKVQFGIIDCANTKYGDFSVYNSIENSIYHKAFIIRTKYVDKGLKTIEQIGAKYAPNDDEDDAQNLNSYWVNNVSSIVEDLLQQQYKQLGSLS